MVLRVKPTPTRFPNSSLYTPMDCTLLHSISSVQTRDAPAVVVRSSKQRTCPIVTTRHENVGKYIAYTLKITIKTLSTNCSQNTSNSTRHMSRQQLPYVVKCLPHYVSAIYTTVYTNISVEHRQKQNILYFHF